MRKLFYFVFVLIVALPLSVFADRTATSTIQNFVSSGGEYSFEVWARRTGTDAISVGTSSFYFAYNAEALITPTLSNVNSKYTGVDGSTEDYAPMTVEIVGAYIAITIHFTGNATFAGRALDTTLPDGELICVVHLTIRDGSAVPGLTWSVNNSAIVDARGLDVTNTFVGSDNTTPLPIQLVSSTANVVRGNDVEVSWKTVSETNNYGFEVYRKRNEGGEWTKLGFIEGHGTTLAAHSYTYLDKSVGFGKYYYQIKQTDLDGKSETFPEMTVTVGVGPDQFVLAQNYPNPFNPTTTIEFVVPITGHTTMEAYNVLGQRVATLFEGNAEGGRINVARFNASNLPSGFYFYTLRAAGKVETKRMLLIK
jgi:hypothetical protein